MRTDQLRNIVDSQTFRVWSLCRRCGSGVWPTLRIDDVKSRNVRTIMWALFIANLGSIPFLLGDMKTGFAVLHSA